MVKTIKIIVILICLICVFFSCTVLYDDEHKDEFIVLNVAIGAGKTNVFQEITSAFLVENPNIKLRFIELDNDLEQYRLISAACSTGDYLFDVVEIEDTWVNDLADNGYILPIEDKLISDDSYISCAKNGFTYNGIKYAVPFQIDSGMMFSLKETGWDGSFENLNGRKIVDNSYDEFVLSLMELINYTDDDIEAALKLYKDIYTFEKDSEITVGLFEKGQIPIMRSYSAILPFVMLKSTPVQGKFDIYSVPKSDKMVIPKIFGFAVSSLTSQVDKCKEFIAYFARENVQIDLCKLTGLYPVRESLYNDISIKSQWHHIEPKLFGMLNAKTRPHKSDYAYEVLQLRECVEGYINGKIPLNDAVIKTKKFFE